MVMPVFFPSVNWISGLSDDSEFVELVLLLGVVSSVSDTSVSVGTLVISSFAEESISVGSVTDGTLALVWISLVGVDAAVTVVA